MGIGGGIITKKLIFTVLLIASLSLSGIAGASASEVGTVQTQPDKTSAVQKSNMQADNTNESAKIGDTTNNSLKTNQTANNTSQASIKTTAQTENATKYTNSTQTLSKETTSANKTQSPVNNASENQTPQAAAGETKTTNTTGTNSKLMFAPGEIKDAAARVKAYIEKNYELPNYVTIGTVQVQMPDFLKLLTAGLLQLNSGSTAPITLKTVSAPTQPSESIKSGNINKSDYLDLAKRVNGFIDANGVLPNYATSTLGKLRYESIIYMYSKILNFYNTNNTLPSYVTVKAWSSISNSVLSQARVVYITSDNIKSVTADTKMINAIVDGLRALGLTAINAGLGPNTHINVLKDSKVPANALIVDIYGGACAGTIYEMGQSYYKKWVGSKKVFSVWMPPSTNITGLAWLPRSKDDNFSPSSFKGLANPDKYLKNNGYEYIYSGDLNAIIAAIYKQATTA